MFHGDEGVAVLLTNVVNSADVWVVQSGGRLRLPLEASQCLRVFGYLIWKKLQGYKAAKSGVLSLIDHAHTAATEFLNAAVMGDGLADERLGLRHLASI